MTIKDKSLTAWQVGIMLFIILFSNKILVLPSLLYEGAKLEAYFVPIILFVLEFGLIYLFYRMKRAFPTQSFAEILQKYFGKVVMKVILFLIMLFFIFKAILLYNVTYLFFKTLIYQDSSNILFLFCFIPVITHLGIMGLRVMGRTMQIFFPLIVGVTVFCIVIGFLGIKDLPLLFQSSIGDIALTSIKHIAGFGDSLLLFLIIDKITIKRGQWKVIFSLSGISMFLVISITAVFLFTYTYTSFLHPFALFEIMCYVKEYGGVGRIDMISMLLIVILTYFQLAIYLKMFMLSFLEVFGKINEIISAISFNLFFILAISYVVLNLGKAILYGENFLPYFAILPFVVVPVLCFIALVLLKREKKK